MPRFLAGLSESRGYLLRIFVGESDNHEGKPLYGWLVQAQEADCGRLGTSQSSAVHSRLHRIRFPLSKTAVVVVVAALRGSGLHAGNPYASNERHLDRRIVTAIRSCHFHTVWLALKMAPWLNHPNLRSAGRPRATSTRRLDFLAASAPNAHTPSSI